MDSIDSLRHLVDDTRTFASSPTAIPTTTLTVHMPLLDTVRVSELVAGLGEGPPVPDIPPPVPFSGDPPFCLGEPVFRVSDNADYYAAVLGYVEQMAAYAERVS